MSFGKLYTFAGNARSTAIKAVAKANKLDLEIVEHDRSQPWPAEYTKVNALGKVPSFEGADGYILTEAIAIAVYITSQNEKTTLLGKTKQDYASILRWLSFFNQEVLPTAGAYFLPILGRVTPFNKKAQEDALQQTYKLFDVVEKHLLINTYLVGERLTLADLFAAGIAQRSFEYILDSKWRKENPNTYRWFETVTNQAIYSEVAPKFELASELLKNVAPKNDAAPKKEKAAAAAPKAAPKPKAKEVDEEEEEEQEKPKAKHPLEALSKPTLVLDDWKRKYSNEETREVALPWFWENYKPEEYSLWQLDYKYNEELTQTFMTSNLIGGFFTRLEASRKYIFGAASVYGVSNDSVIKGAFVIRGQEALPAFDVAPDFESYEFTKLDPTKAEDKEFINDQWSWDKPITVNGKTYEWADGKVFK